VNAGYRMVAARIRSELSELHRVVERTLLVWQRARQTADDYLVDAAALNLHGFYAGLERVFEIVADEIDQSRPSGSHWHQELLRQMSSGVTNVRPPVLSLGLRNRLDKYRGFRHVVRNVYTFNLDVDLIELLVRQLQPTMGQLSQELLAFADVLEQVGT
jgi:hypothetical protein